MALSPLLSTLMLSSFPYHSADVLPFLVASFARFSANSIWPLLMLQAKKTKKYTNHKLKLNLLATNRLSLNVSSERDSMNLCRICHLSDYQCVRRNSMIFHSESHNEQRAISCYDSSELDFHLVRIAHIENASENRIEKPRISPKHSATRFFALRWLINIGCKRTKCVRILIYGNYAISFLSFSSALVLFSPTHSPIWLDFLNWLEKVFSHRSSQPINK